MRTQLIVFSACLLAASAAMAHDAVSPTGSSITAQAARKAYEMRFADGNRKNILEVDPGPNGSLAMVEIVDGSAGIKVPGNTITAGDSPHQLQTSLTLNQLEGHP